MRIVIPKKGSTRKRVLGKVGKLTKNHPYGFARLANPFLQEGRGAVAMDLSYGGEGMDLSTPAGFIAAVYQTCRLSPGSGWLAALVCSSFVWVPLDNKSTGFVHDAPKVCFHVSTKHFGHAVPFHVPIAMRTQGVGEQQREVQPGHSERRATLACKWVICCYAGPW